MRKLEEGLIIFEKATPEELYYIIGIKKDSPVKYTVSVLNIDKDTMESKKGLTLEVPKKELSKWGEYKI